MGGGDITFDVQGRKITAKVTSVRKVDWRNSRTGFMVLFRPGTLEPYPTPAFQINMTQILAQSRGRVTLSSPDPMAAPRIQFNYLQDPQDLRTFREAVRLTREVVATRAMAP